MGNKSTSQVALLNLNNAFPSGISLKASHRIKCAIFSDIEREATESAFNYS